MPTAAVYQFGSFELDPEERSLLRAGDPVAPGVSVEEVNLAQNISAIRHALCADDEQLYVQTVSDVGYRFVASVRTILVADHDSEAGHANGRAAHFPPRAVSRFFTHDASMRNR